jgi:A118 family predicted phage portal protein
MVGVRTIEQTLHVAPVISSQMEEAIQNWTDMYKNRAYWIKEPSAADPVRVVSLGLPAMIASEKARTALLEFKSEITAPTEEVEIPNPEYKEPEPDAFGNIIPSAQPPMIKEQQPIGSTDRADYLNKQYEKLKKQLRRQFEYAVAKGGIVIKPFPSQNVDGTWDFIFDFIQADNFFPLAFDSSGQITEAAFIETKFEGNLVFRRLEYHKWEGRTVKIVNKAFKSTNTQNEGDISGMDLGQEVPLTDVPEWKDMQAETNIGPVTKPLFAYFRMPQANTIDTSSPLGVSGYSRAVSLIKDADEQYSRLLWEYEAGEMAIDIDRDALNFIEGGTDREGNRIQGHSVLGKMQQRLYRKVDLGESSTYEPHNPTLRDGSYNQGLNTILMRIEDVCEISRGTLSDASAEARTATELKILKQRTYSNNLDNQLALQDTLDEVVYIMDVYCDLFQITPKGDYNVSYEWDDSILVDVDTELGKRITLQQNGLASKLENRMWYFGETEEQARQALVKIQDESREAMEDNLMLQSNLSREEEE